MTGRDPVFVDTSALYALADRDDRHHLRAKAIVARIKRKRPDALTTSYIVAETHALILSRMGAERARLWLAHFLLPVHQVTEEDQAAARSIIMEHTDKDYSLVDATSFSVMRRLGTRLAFAFDVHFAQFGFELLKA